MCAAHEGPWLIGCRTTADVPNLGEVNWRRGSLWPYESMASVGAKYCHLNKVRPSEFLKFLNRFSSPVRPIEFWKWLDCGSFDDEAMSVALREAPEHVARLRWTPFLPPEGYADGPPNRRIYDPEIHIRFCPECARRGLHAIFHQLPWLRKCLLHEIELPNAK